jgi:hypothetical protein
VGSLGLEQVLAVVQVEDRTGRRQRLVGRRQIDDDIARAGEEG